MQALPGSALEVIETEFLFQLLMSLLANPSRLDGGRQDTQLSLRRQVGEVIFLLSRHPVFANKPSLFSGQMLLALVPDPQSSITSVASLPPASLSVWTSSSVSTGTASQTPAAMKWCN
jgi:hypothetical protein